MYIQINQIISAILIMAFSTTVLSLDKTNNIQHSKKQNHLGSNTTNNTQTVYVDPTKPSSFLFDPLFNSGFTEKDNNISIGNKNLFLTAIFIAPNKKVAVINGKIFKEGDSVNGKTIQEIKSDSVKLLDDKESIELKVIQYSVKQETT